MMVIELSGVKFGPIICVISARVRFKITWGDFEHRLKYLIRRALYLGYRIRVGVD